MNKNKENIKKNKKIKFVIYFILSYILLLIIGLYLLGNPLMSLQYFILKLIFYENISSQLLFVAHCSGIISIVTYLAMVISFLGIKERTSVRKILASIFILLLYNLFRLIIIVYVANKSISLANFIHVFSWLIIFVILIVLALKDYKQVSL